MNHSYSLDLNLRAVVVKKSFLSKCIIAPLWYIVCQYGCCVCHSVCNCVTPHPTQLCSELAAKLNETASQPLQETATKKRVVFKKVTMVMAIVVQ